MREACIN